MLEESRERRYDQYARVLQKAFRQFTAAKRHAKEKEEACQLVYGLFSFLCVDEVFIFSFDCFIISTSI